MKKLLSLLAVSLLFTACEPDETKSVTTIDPVVSMIMMPDTIRFGETADITMSYTIQNECGVFIGTDVVRDGNDYFIRPMVRYTVEEGMSCPEKITTEVATAQIKPEAPGKYLLYFKKGNPDIYLADTLIVKQ